MCANQLILRWSTLAYVLLHALRSRALAGTRLTRAQYDTLRLRLLKYGPHICVTASCVWVASTDYLPDTDLFIIAANRLPPGAGARLTHAAHRPPPGRRQAR